MLAEHAAPMNAAQRAWATRRARDAARIEIAAIKAGVTKPSPAYNPDKPVVDLWLDDARKSLVGSSPISGAIEAT